MGETEDEFRGRPTTRFHEIPSPEVVVRITATVFGVGRPAGGGSGNAICAYDDYWSSEFGGLDDYKTYRSYPFFPSLCLRDRLEAASAREVFFRERRGEIAQRRRRVDLEAEVAVEAVQGADGA